MTRRGETKYVNVDGSEVAYQVVGKGALDLVYTGECEKRGGDVGGIAVHIGARVAAEAGSSQVLVSSTVKDLVVGSGIAFEDRGSKPLKGVPDEWRLFAVAATTWARRRDRSRTNPSVASSHPHGS